MSSLPRDADRLVTKDDLSNGLAVLKAEVLGAIDSRITVAVRLLFFAIIASNATLVGLVFAAVKLG